MWLMAFCNGLLCFWLLEAQTARRMNLCCWAGLDAAGLKGRATTGAIRAAAMMLSATGAWKGAAVRMG